MEGNDVQLEHFGFTVDENDTIEETFTSIKRAQSVSTISSLLFYYVYEIDLLDVQQNVIDLCLDLKYLTKLHVESEFFSSNTPVLLVEILKNLTMLKSLDFRGFKVDENMEDNDLFYNTLSSNIHIGRMESICLERPLIQDGDKSIKKTNLRFTSILGSCPNLKEIKIKDSSIRARGGINLDFREHHFLHYVELDFFDCRYYDFHHEFGKRWRNVKDQIKAEDLTLDEEASLPFTVNLA